MKFYRRVTAVFLMGALIAMVIVACTDSTASDDQSTSAGPTATFSPADATATWVAFKPERDKIIAEILKQQDASATALAATQIAIVAAQPTATVITESTEPTIEATTGPPATAPRAIATAPVNRIAFEDGKGSIFTVNPDGTDTTTIGDGSTTSGKARYTFPVWSPEGGSLLFSSIVIAGGAVSQSALHRADADGNSAD